MKRNKLVIIELITTILIVIGIFFLVFNLYFIFKNSGKDIVYINDKNREYVKNIIAKSENFNNIDNFNNVKKIQYFLAFNNMEFTLYYKDGATEKIIDDGMDNLREYIEEHGYNKGNMFTILGLIVIFACIGLNEVRKNVSNKIDLINKINE